MARTQAKLLAAIWSDPDWIALTDSAQRLYLLLLSQPKLALTGCLDVMPARWARLAVNTDEAAVNDALTELVKARFVVVHHDELVIRSFVAHDLAAGAVNRNLVKGMWSAWGAIGSPLLRKVVVDGVPDSVWETPGVEPPSEALRLRSQPRLELPLEPRFEQESEPQIEPSVDLLPAVCSLLPATPIDSQDYTGSGLAEPVAPSGDEEAGAGHVAPDTQAVRKTAVLVGRAVAGSTPGVQNPQGYAAKVTAAILDSSGDGIDREAIERRLSAGEAPAAIAAAWLGNSVLSAPQRPTLTAVRDACSAECINGWDIDVAGTAHRCQVCNPDPLGVAPAKAAW